MQDRRASPQALRSSGMPGTFDGLGVHYKYSTLPLPRYSAQGERRLLHSVAIAHLVSLMIQHVPHGIDLFALGFVVGAYHQFPQEAHAEQLDP